MFRVKVLLTSKLGNPKEITTLCKSKSEVKRRIAMYQERYQKDNGYEDVEIFTEEINEVEE